MNGMKGMDDSGAANPIRYTGREMDETGLYYYRARYYSPVMGRFISEDPIGFGGGMNWYAYVENSPVNWVDPLGLDQLVPDVPLPEGAIPSQQPGEINNALLCHVNPHRDPMENAIGGAVLAGAALGATLAGSSSVVANIIRQSAPYIPPIIDHMSRFGQRPSLKDGLQDLYGRYKERSDAQRLPSQCVYGRAYLCHGSGK